MKSFWRQTGLVAVGASFGALFRELVFLFVELFLQESPGGLFDWPWALLIVNVSGAFVLGWLLVVGSQLSRWQETYRPFLAVGILGGYTTTSAFAVVTVEMLRNGNFVSALLNIGLSVGLAIWAFSAAQKLANARMAKP
jgi:fluoride exporter